MVVPVYNSPASVDSTKKFVGNNLNIDIPENIVSMVVIGNNCTVKIGDNRGAVKIVGNNCAVNVGKSSGSVKYIGNNGRITFNCDIKKENVTYCGKNGTVKGKNMSFTESSASASYGLTTVSSTNIKNVSNFWLGNRDDMKSCTIYSIKNGIPSNIQCRMGVNVNL